MEEFKSITIIHGSERGKNADLWDEMLLNWHNSNVTNEDGHRNIQVVIGEYTELLTMSNKRKLSRLAQISKSSGLALSYSAQWIK